MPHFVHLFNAGQSRQEFNLDLLGVFVNVPPTGSQKVNRHGRFGVYIWKRVFSRGWYDSAATMSLFHVSAVYTGRKPILSTLNKFEVYDRPLGMSSAIAEGTAAKNDAILSRQRVLIA